MRHRKVWFGTAIALMITAIGVAFAKPFSFNYLARVRADLSNLSVTFSSTSGSQTVRSDYYFYREATTSLGTKLYLRNVSHVALSSTQVANMNSSFDKGSITPEINFTTTNLGTSGTSQFEFKNIKSISAFSNSATSRSLTVYKSSDGTNWESAGTLAVTSSGGANSDVEGAKYIKLGYSGSFNVILTRFIINYSCSDGPTPDKKLSSITLSGQTTEYIIGDSFSFDGKVTAHYSDSSSLEVLPSSVTNPGMTSAGEKEIVVTYTEEDITKSASYFINVSSSGRIYLSGTYGYASRSVHLDGDDWTGCMTLTFTSDGKCTWRNVRGSTIIYDCKVFFDYVAISNGTNIELTMTVCEGSDSDKYDYRMQGNPTTSAKAFSGGDNDRPANKGITATGAGNSGLVSLDRQSLTISVYQYANSTYSYYDTFTFTLS